MTFNRKNYVVTLERGLQRVKVILGTPFISVNGNTINVSDCSAEVGGQPYIQREAVDALFGS